jgi:hypothetical protein
MQAETVLQVPPISIESWPAMAMDKNELRIILTFLAYKTKKPVTFKKYVPDEGYANDSVSVRIAIKDGQSVEEAVSHVKINGKSHKLADSQVRWDIDVDCDKQLQDDDGLILAYIDHNMIVIPIELTAVDNESGRHVLAYILEQALDKLDFSVDDHLLEKRDEMIGAFCHLFREQVRERIREREKELTDLKRSADQAYHTIVSFQNRKPVIDKELDHLKRLRDIPDPVLFKKQAKMLVDLATTGDFTSIKINDDDDSIRATTGPIAITYQDHDFDMGRYEIIVDNTCDVRIKALDEHPNAEYPHPHVAQDGYPCLGNISAEIPALLGSMHIAEALQILHEFLCSYSPDTTPYESIAHFDPNGTFRDENDNPCENCDESCSPYCVARCSNNDSRYSSSDCSEYRSTFCYAQCDNQQFCDLSPCDNCDDNRTQHCFLECDYNEDWQKHDPCESVCEFDPCSSECPYHQKLQSIKENQNA